MDEEDEDAKENEEDDDKMDGEGEESEKKETEDPKEANMNEDEKIDAEYGLNDYDDGIFFVTSNNTDDRFDNTTILKIIR